MGSALHHPSWFTGHSVQPEVLMVFVSSAGSRVDVPCAPARRPPSGLRPALSSGFGVSEAWRCRGAACQRGTASAGGDHSCHTAPSQDHLSHLSTVHSELQQQGKLPQGCGDRFEVGGHPAEGAAGPSERQVGCVEARQYQACQGLLGPVGEGLCPLETGKEEGLVEALGLASCPRAPGV